MVEKYIDCVDENNAKTIESNAVSTVLHLYFLVYLKCLGVVWMWTFNVFASNPLSSQIIDRIS